MQTHWKLEILESLIELNIVRVWRNGNFQALLVGVDIAWWDLVSKCKVWNHYVVGYFQGETGVSCQSGNPNG